jgi:hypothetical protein
MRDNSRYIRKSPTGEYFDIHAYEDDEQMMYLAEQCQREQVKKMPPSKKRSLAVRLGLIRQR